MNLVSLPRLHTSVHSLCNYVRTAIVPAIVAVWLLLSIVMPVEVFGQKATRPKELPTGQVPNFYQVQKEWTSYFEALKKEKLEANPNNENPLKGTGWKQYKRWEWYWQSRVNPDGTFPDPSLLVNALNAESAKRKNQKNPSLESTTWAEMGPSSPADPNFFYWGIGRVNNIAINQANVNDIWLATAGGGVWRSSNGGTTWTERNGNLPVLPVTDIVVDWSDASGNTVYIAHGDYVGNHGRGFAGQGVFKTTNGGTTWTNVRTATLVEDFRVSRIIQSRGNASVLWIATNRGIQRTSDGGATWSAAVETGTNFCDLEVKPNDPNTLYASTRAGGAMRSTDGGATWTAMTFDVAPNTGRTAIAVSDADPNYVYLISVASNSSLDRVYRITNGGTAFTTVTTNSGSVTNPNLLGYNADGSDGTAGQGDYDLTIFASPTNANVVYIGGINIWRSDDGGGTWTSKSMWNGNGRPTLHADQHAVFVSTAATGTVYFGNDGGLYRSTDFGETYTQLNNGLSITQLYRLGASANDANILVAGAQDNSSMFRQANGTWTTAVPTGDGMESLVDWSNNAIMYSESYFGDIRRTTNSWASSTTVAAGNGTAGTHNEQGAWVTPYVQHPVQSQTFFVGKKQIYRTVDNWANFTALGPTATAQNIDLIALARSNDAHMYIIRAGVLMYTANLNAGTPTWTARTNPSGGGNITWVDVDPTNPLRIVITIGGTTAGEKVYLSTDAGATFTNISGTLPNVPTMTATFQRNAPGRIYVGNDLGVYYRDNSTTDWQVLGTGLPKVAITELETQPGLAGGGKLRVATWGRGVWQVDLLSSAPVISTVASATTITTGATITVTGTDLSAILFATVGGQTMTVNSSTATQLVGVIPAGAVSGLLMLNSAGGSASTTLTFTVAQVGQLVATPNPMSFGSVTAGTVFTTTQTLTLSGTNFAANQVVTLNTTRGGVSFSANGISANGAGEIASTNITVTWALPNNLPVGMTTGVITFGGTTATVDFGVNIIPAPVGQLTATPNPMSFGSVTSGTALTTTQTLTLSGANFGANQVVTLSTTRGGVTFAPPSVTADGTGMIANTPVTVTWNVPNSLPIGLTTGTITFSGTTATVDFGVNIIPAPVGQLTATPNPMSFGSVTSGTALTTTQTLTVGGMNFGANQQILLSTTRGGVTFAPPSVTADGTGMIANTPVTVTWNVANNLPVGMTTGIITFSGTTATVDIGVNIIPPPPLTVSIVPATINFGNVYPNDTRVGTVEITGSGYAPNANVGLSSTTQGVSIIPNATSANVSGNVGPFTAQLQWIIPQNAQPGVTNAVVMVGATTSQISLTATVLQVTQGQLALTVATLSFGTSTSGIASVSTQTFTLAGTNFAPNQQIMITTTRGGVTFAPPSVTADGTGTIPLTTVTATWNIPGNIPVGLTTNTITFSGTTATLGFTLDLVAPPATGVLTLSSSTAVFGSVPSGIATSTIQTVNISGTGFLANQNVTIQTTVAGLTANPQSLIADGAGVIANTPVTLTWNVPTNLPLGITTGVVTFGGTSSTVGVLVNIIPPPLSVTFNPPQVQFGNVAQNTSATAIVQISGVGYTPNSAVNFTTTMAGITVNPTTTNANANGQFGPMNIGVTLNGNGLAIAQTSGSIEVSGTTAQIIVQGNITAPATNPTVGLLTLNPTTLSFGSVTAGSVNATTQTFTVSGVGFAANQAIAIASASQGLTFNPTTLQASASGAIVSTTVTASWLVQQGVPAGFTSGTIIFTNTNATIAVSVNVTAPATNANAPAGLLTLNPTTLSFGSVTSGTAFSTTQTFSVSGTGFTANQVINILTTQAGVTVAPTSVTATANGTVNQTNITVTWAVPNNLPVGLTSGTIMFGGTTSVVNIAVNIIPAPPVVAPILSVTPGGLNFGAVTIGASSTQTFTVTGTGFAANQAVNITTTFQGLTLAPTTTNATANGTVGPFTVVGTWIAPGANTSSVVNGAIAFSGTTTTVSVVGQLVVPAPVAPVLGAVTNLLANSFTINWSASANTTSYVVDVASDAAFANLVVNGGQAGANLVFAVTGLQPNTNYTYRVRAIGAGGQVNSAPQSVLTLPVAPLNPSATAISATSFIASWSAPAGGATSYELDVNTAQGFTGTAILSSTSTVNTSFTVTGLTQGTTYFWRVRSVNASGRSENSTPLTATTLTPVLAPVATSAANITSTSFTANWTASTGATSYALDVATDAGFTSLIPGSANLTTTDLFLNVQGLTGNTQYFYRVRSLGANNQGGTSNTVSVTTVPGQVTGVNVINPTATGFTVVWTPPTGGAPTYTVEVLRSATSLASKTRDEIEQVNLVLVTSATVQSPATSATFTGLAQGVQYSVRVRAGNASGTTDGSGSGTVSNIVTLSPPNPPTNLVRTQISATTLTIAWTAPANATTEITYRVDVATDAALTQIVQGNITVNTTSLTIVNLVGNTNYTVQVRSVNPAGTSANAAIASFLTVPSRPIANAVTGATATSFTASWTAPLPLTNAPLTYQVELSPNADMSGALQVIPVQGIAGQQVLSTVVTGLQSNTQYFYRVRALNATGISEASNVIPVRTAQPVFSINGRVSAGANAQAGVTLNLLAGSFPNPVGIPSGILASTQSDATGQYVFTNVTIGTYTIVPAFAGLQFAPQTRIVNVSTGNVDGQDFVGSVPRFAVSGRVTNATTGAGIPGLSVVITPAVPDNTPVVTDTNGNYSFLLANGNYSISIVTPPNVNLIISPALRQVVVNNAPLTGQDFTASTATFSLGGRVASQAGIGVAGITVQIVRGTNATTTPVRSLITGQDGTYATTLEADVYTVFAVSTSPNVSFAPASIFIQLNANNTGVNFTAQIPSVISGRVSDQNGVGLVGIQIITQPAVIGINGQPIRTTANGAYTISVPDGQYVITPISTIATAQLRFTPPTRLVNVSGASVTGQDFTATPQVYSIGGRVTSRGLGLAGTIVTMASEGGNATALRSTITSSTGTYQFVDVTTGTYSIAVQTQGLIFAQNPIRVNVSSANLTNVNFDGIPQTVQVSGTVLGANGTLTPAPVVTARLLVAGSTSVITTTANATGQYVFNLEQGIYRIAPQPIAGLIFAPGSVEITVTGASIGGVNFTASTATYSIAGRTVLDNTSLSGVRVTLRPADNVNASGATIQSAPDGTFTFVNIAPGTFVLTAQAEGFTFTPSTANVTLSTSNLTNVVFNAQILPIAVSGRVTDASGNGIPNVSILVSPSFAGNTPLLSGQDGRFTANVLGGRTYSFIVSRAGFTFTPASQTVSVATVPVNNVNFTGSPASYTVTGRIEAVGNIPLGGVVVNLTNQAGGTPRTAVLDATGRFTFSSVTGGTYTIAPVNTGTVNSLAFTPAQQILTVSTSNATANFRADLLRFAVSGAITDQGGRGIAGIEIRYQPVIAGTPAVVSGDDGTYTLNLPNGQYTIIPTGANIVLVPNSRPVTVSGATVSAVNFTTSTPTFAVSGRVATPAGVGVGGIRVLIANANNPTPLTDITDPQGVYSTRVPAGTYRLTIASEVNQTTFYTPTAIERTVSADIANLNFVARPPMTLSGRVTENGAGVAGVRVIVSNPAIATFGRLGETDATGGFSFAGMQPGLYTIQASRLNTVMTPSQQIVSLDTLDISQATFTAETIRDQVYTVSGTVRDAEGNPLANARVSLRGATVLSILTNANGSYSFTDVPRGFYLLRAEREGFIFQQAERQAFVNANLAGSAMNFVGTIVPTRLDVPALITPIAGATDVANPVQFSFGTVSSANQYDMEVGRDAAMANRVFALTTDRTFVSIFLAPNTYFWRVRARAGSLVSDWSVARSFDISATPTLISPRFGETVTSATVNLTWSPIQGITSYQVRYSRSIIDVLEPLPAGLVRPNVASTATVDGNVLTVNASTLLPSTTYYWQARGNDRQGRSWSFYQAFRTPASATPPVVQLTAPANNGTVNGFSGIAFRWTVPADQLLLADRYTLQMSDEPTFTSNRTVNRNVGRGLARVENFVRQSFSRGRLFWRVQAFNSLGSTVSETNTFGFPALVSRNAIAQESDIPPQFAITQTDGEVGYVSVPVTAVRRILGRSLQEGDIVGTFYRRNDSLICGGYGLASSTDELFIPTYARLSADSKDGFEAGETLIFQVWDGQSRALIPSPTVEYAVNSPRVFSVDSTITLRRIEVVATSIGRSIVGVNLNVVAVPNPATDFVNIDWQSKVGESYTVTVMNTIGMEVARFSGRSMSDVQRIQWTTDKVPNGAYTVRIETLRGINSAKVMVVK
jgi:hypothetical protein